MNDRVKVVTLIRKLLAKAESAKQIGSVAEAATFAAKANELLLQHQLEMSEVEVQELETTDPIDRKRVDLTADYNVRKGPRLRWAEDLAYHISKAHFCDFLVVPGTRIFIFVGRPADREVAAWLFGTLAAMGERLAQAFYYTSRNERAKQGLGQLPRAKEGFLTGFVRAIGERLRALRHQTVQANGRHALVRFENAELAVQKWVAAQKVGKAGNLKNNPAARDAFDAGHRAGSTASLQPGIRSGTSATPTMIGGAQ